jgi:hypothetical protein
MDADLKRFLQEAQGLDWADLKALEISYRNLIRAKSDAKIREIQAAERARARNKNEPPWWLRPTK